MLGIPTPRCAQLSAGQGFVIGIPSQQKTSLPEPSLWLASLRRWHTFAADFEKEATSEAAFASRRSNKPAALTKKAASLLRRPLDNFNPVLCYT